MRSEKKSGRKVVTSENYLALTQSAKQVHKVAAVHAARGRLALSRIREAARRKGSARMTLDEINSEIAAVRHTRRVAR